MSGIPKLQNHLDDLSPFSPGKDGFWLGLTFLMVFVGWSVVGQNPETDIPQYEWKSQKDLAIVKPKIIISPPYISINTEDIIIAIATDPQGNVYTLSFGKGVAKRDADGNMINAQFIPSGELDNPLDIAIDEVGFIYIADFLSSGEFFDNGKIKIFGPNGNYLPARTILTSFYRPLGLDVNDDNVYVAEFNDAKQGPEQDQQLSRVRIYNKNNGILVDETKQVEVPFRIAVDSKKNVFVSQAGNSDVDPKIPASVLIFDQNLNYQGKLPNIISPGSVVVDSFDFIHVLEYGDKINFEQFIDYENLNTSETLELYNKIDDGINNHDFIVKIYDTNRSLVKTIKDNVSNEFNIEFPVDIAFNRCDRMYINNVKTVSGLGLDFDLEIYQRTPSFDIVKPVALCIAPGKEFILVNGSVTITTADINAGSSDNCSLTLSLSQTTFTSPGIKNITLTASDGAGNTGSCTTTIEIKNPFSPPINCKPTTIFLGTNGIAILNPADIFDGDSNTPDIDHLEVDKKDFTCPDLGFQSVKLAVFYTNGTTAVCNAQVTIVDNIDPVALCIAPGKEFILVNGSVTITTADINAGSIDNCSLTLNISQTTFTTPGIKNITLTASDGAGNTGSCTTTIEIKNPFVPPINCKPTTIFLGTNGLAILNPADIFDGDSNTPDIDHLEVDKKDFTCPDLGSQPVVLTVFYTNGTTAVCNAQVTIADTIAPVAKCATGYDIWLNANGTASLNAIEINKQSSDNCGIESMEIDKTTFTSADIGVIIVALTVIDVAGNSDSCETSVTVHPYAGSGTNFTCLTEFVLQLDESGNAVLIAEDLYTGDPGNRNFFLSKTSFNCSNIGNNQVDLSYTGNDGSGTCEINVIVEDRISPEARTRNLNVTLDSFGIATITPEMIDNGSTDNCGTLSFSLDRISFSCIDLGENVIRLTVKDAQGNIASGTAIVNISGNCVEEPEEPSEETFEYIFIYPNPTPGPFTFDTPTGWSIEKVEVYDARGRYVLTENYSGNQIEYSMDLSSLQQAIYILKLYTSRGIRIIRVIIY